MVNIYEEHNKIETTVSFGGGGVGDNNNATMDNPNCLSPSVGGYCIGANMNSPAEAGATGSFGIISATVPNSKYSGSYNGNDGGGYDAVGFANTK